MNAFVDGVLQPALVFLGEWSLRWGVLIGLLAVGLGLLRPRRASVRHLTCACVLLAGLALPAVPHWGPGWPGEAVGESAEVALRDPASGGRQSPEFSNPPQRPDGRRSPEQLAPLPPETRVLRSPLGPRRLLVLALGTAWMVGVLFLLARWAIGWLCLRRLRQAALPLTGWSADRFAACREEMGLHCRVILGSHPRVRSPVLCGVWRPAVLVPPDWPDLTEEAQRGALLHELAHLARGDHWQKPLLQVVRIAFFFHPLVRWLLARLEKEGEILCDETAVAHGIDPSAFARLLLDFARRGGRLGPALLDFGKRATVQARIHHLLEENMERWLSPLPRRRALLLAALVLGLATALGSLGLRARETEGPSSPPRPQTDGPFRGEAPAPKPPREALRYGGKNFDQWRTELATELKPSVRAEAMKALSAFGANGYSAEAAAVILETMRGYDFDKAQNDQEDGKVVQAAMEACGKLDVAAVPVFREGLNSSNRNVRQFAITALQEMKSAARAAVPDLIAKFEDKDFDQREWAIVAARSINPQARELLPALLRGMKDESAGVRSTAAGLLGSQGSLDKAVVPALVAALEDPNGEVRRTSLQSLGSLKAIKPALVPKLAPLVQDEDGQVRQLVFQNLREMGPGAKEAVPALVEALKVKATQEQALWCLYDIGLDARDAIPALKDLLRTSDDTMRGKITTVLRRLDR